MVLGLITESTVIRACEGCKVELVRNTSFGRKRIGLANTIVSLDREDDGSSLYSKRHCFQDSFPVTEKSSIEALPQDVLTRVLCGVNHDDLKRLFFVSKAIRQATIVAKELHFAYNTPKKTMGFQNAFFFSESDEIEAPNAPKQSRVHQSRLNAKKLADIAVTLFSSDIDA